MLSDDVIAAADGRFSVPAIGEAYRDLASEIRNAQRFDLSREVVMFVHSIAEMNASQVIAALGICRLPYPRMWVEFIFRDREDYIQQSGAVPNQNDRASPPSRLGFLVEQRDDNAIEVTPVWRHREGAIRPGGAGLNISIGGLSVVIDTSPDFVASEARKQEYLALYEKTQVDKTRQFMRDYRDPRHRDAWIELECRIQSHPSRFMVPFWAFVMQNLPNEVDKLMNDAAYDLFAEWKFIIGLLIVFNSRNVVEPSAEISFERLNKSRLKKNKPPVMSYRELRMHLSRVQSHRLGNEGKRDIEKHIVLGHWKVRKTGVFWWSPFVRGNVAHQTRVVVP